MSFSWSLVNTFIRTLMDVYDKCGHNLNMRFVYVLEDDAKFQKDLVDAILSIDPSIQVRLFKSLEEFAEWIKVMMTEGSSAIVKGGKVPNWLPPGEATESEEHQLAMVVSKIEFLGSKQIPLMKKTRDLFVSRKICSQEDPTAFVLTTFEDPQFNLKLLENRILNNIIFKPFDKLILIQHLTFAIDGRHPPSSYTIANQKMTAIVEMLKEVKMLAISDVGFVTSSNRQMEKGRISKYYGSQFIGRQQKSLMAMLIESQPVPGKSDEFLNSFMFFGTSIEQISQIRKNLRSSKLNYQHHWPSILADQSRIHQEHGIVLIDEDVAFGDEIVDSIERNFKKCKIVRYQNLVEFLIELDPKLVDKSETQLTKAFPAETTLEFVFNDQGSKLQDLKSSKKDPIVVFGKRQVDLLANENAWAQLLGAEQMLKWKDWVQSQKPLTLKVKLEKNSFYFKPTSLQRDPATQQLLVQFVELSASERLEYLQMASEIPKRTDLILISHRFLQTADHEKWLKIKDLLKQRSGLQTLDTQIFMTAEKPYSDSELIQYGALINDIFYKPLDRNYLLKKMRVHFPELQLMKNDIEILTKSHEENIHTASPVQISEISEAGLVMQYYRAVSIGAFREFVLWQPAEFGAPKLVGSCNFSEESSQKGIFNNHFVFYGVTDLFLKSIRIWIRNNYITQKEQGS